MHYRSRISVFWKQILIPTLPWLNSLQRLPLHKKIKSKLLTTAYAAAWFGLRPPLASPGMTYSSYFVHRSRWLETHLTPLLPQSLCTVLFPLPGMLFPSLFPFPTPTSYTQSPSFLLWLRFSQGIFPDALRIAISNRIPSNDEKGLDLPCSVRQPLTTCGCWYFTCLVWPRSYLFN